MINLRRLGLWALGGLAAIIVALYLAVPALLLYEFNQVLGSLPGFKGHVAALHIRFWHPTLKLHGLTVVERGSKASVPLVRVKEIDIHYGWADLVHGGFVGTLLLQDPVIHYVLPPKAAKKNPAVAPEPSPKATAQAAKAGAADKSQRENWALARWIGLRDGRLEIEDDDVKAGYMIYIKDVRGEIENFATKPGLTKKNLSLGLAGTVMEKGELKAQLVADEFAAQPTFEYKTSMTGVALPPFNDLLRHYADIEAHDGSMDFYSEAKCVGGQLKGYVKPLIVGLEAVNVKGGKSIGKQLKGEAAKLASKVLKNPRSQGIGTKAAFSGNLNDPKVKLVPAALGLLSNAFIKAVRPGLGGLVDFKALLSGKKS